MRNVHLSTKMYQQHKLMAFLCWRLCPLMKWILRTGNCRAPAELVLNILWLCSTVRSLVHFLRSRPEKQRMCLPHVSASTFCVWRAPCASLVAQLLKNPPAKQETWVRPLGQEDSPGEELATHSNILAWRIPRTEETGRLQSMGSQRVRHD